MSCKLIAVILISYTWLVPFLVLLFPLLKIGGRYGFNRVASRCSVVMVTNVPYEIVLKVMNSLIPLAIMIVCYIIIFIKIMKTRQRFNFEESAIRVQGARAVGLLRFKAEIRLTYIAFLTCAWFSICYIPLSIHGLIATEVYQLQSPLAQALVLMTWIGKNSFHLSL
jgi:7 transmembrane receptor (rhodopsin family)